jgi:hypothetical protein
VRVKKSPLDVRASGGLFNFFGKLQNKHRAQLRCARLFFSTLS